MQRVISHMEQRLYNGKNQEKNGTRFFFNGTIVGFNGTVFFQRYRCWEDGTIAGATGDK